MTSWRIGADIGGTFTDVVVLDDQGRIGVAKTSTTPRALTQAVMQAIDAATVSNEVDSSCVSMLAHATTVVTNALLEERGANALLVTTAGFRDVLELRRSARADLYDLFQDAPSVLIPRRRRFEIGERIDANGDVVEPLNDEEIEVLIAQIRDTGVQAVAVSLLFSFLNDSHERQLGARLRAALPQVPVFLSSEVLPEIREFERTSTTAVCAYVSPILESYLRELDEQARTRGLPSPFVMGSGGGVLAIDEALAMPAMVVESGPAAGVVAANAIGEYLGKKNLLSFDMGGTTAKASLIRDGQVETTPEYEVGGARNVSQWTHGTGHPIRVPVIDLAEVSAGGGSIAWVDPAAALRVGPQSAGAEPGPVCYAQGGEQPTVTDANLVLGRLDQQSLLGGALPIDADRARSAIDEKIAKPLGLQWNEAAAGVLDIVNNAMAETLRTVSVERGHDPRELALVAFGGAGPLHAVALAEELEMREVVVPPASGAFSALGLVATDVKRTYARSFFQLLDDADPNAIESVYADMETTARAMLDRCGIDDKDRVFERGADLRYRRQAYELTVVTERDTVDGHSLEELAASFHEKHETTYGHANTDEPVQLVTLRLTATGKLPGINLRHRTDNADDPIKGERPVWFKSSGWRNCFIYERSAIAQQARVLGPAVVESLDSTLVVPPGWQLQAHPGDVLILTPTEETA